MTHWAVDACHREELPEPFVCLASEERCLIGTFNIGADKVQPERQGCSLKLPDPVAGEMWHVRVEESPVDKEFTTRQTVYRFMCEGLFDRFMVRDAVHALEPLASVPSVTNFELWRPCNTLYASLHIDLGLTEDRPQGCTVLQLVR